MAGVSHFRRSIFAVWHWPRWVWAVVVVLLLAVSWGTTYAMLAERICQPRFDRIKWLKVVDVDVCYPALRRVPSEIRGLITLALRPAHLVDRQLRPRYWKMTFGQWMEELDQ